MSDVQFVIGKLIENEIGAFYEGSVFDRWLKVELPNGKIITIFDSELIFDGLTDGETYEFILAPLSIPRENLRNGLSERDVVLDIQEILEWQPREPFIIICPDLLEKTLTIAKTFLGTVVLLGQEAESEMYIDDDNQRKLIAIRLDLLGVRAIE
jgi:hypothetical protein